MKSPSDFPLIEEKNRISSSLFAPYPLIFNIKYQLLTVVPVILTYHGASSSGSRRRRNYKDCHIYELHLYMVFVFCGFCHTSVTSRAFMHIQILLESLFPLLEERCAPCYPKLSGANRGDYQFGRNLPCIFSDPPLR